MRSTALFLALACLAPMARAQGDLAYMPAAAPHRTADDEVIRLFETESPAIVRFSLPASTYMVDLLNAQGNVVEQLVKEDLEAFDITRLKPGTWTLRAHTPQGFRVRRFVVHQREGRNWVVEAAAPPKRR